MQISHRELTKYEIWGQGVQGLGTFLLLVVHFCEF